MPVIKIFCAQRPEADACERLAQTLRDLCIGPMGAKPDAIQLTLMPGVQMLDGAPVQQLSAPGMHTPGKGGAGAGSWLASAANSLIDRTRPRYQNYALRGRNPDEQVHGGRRSSQALKAQPYIPDICKA